MKTAFVFTGQGSQYIGMGKDLYEHILKCKEIFDKANDILSFDIKELVFNGNKEDLDITENTQPAILVTSVTARKALEERGIKADVVARLSLGGYSALVCANALSFEEAVALVKKGERYIQEAVPVGIGSIAAIIGLPIRKVKIAIENFRGKGIVEIANYDTNNQIVIGEEKEAVERAKELCLEYGVKGAIELKVSGPFHAPLLERASIGLKEGLKNIEFNKPDTKITSNITAEFVDNKSSIKELLFSQIRSSVKWSRSIKEMLNIGVDTFIEFGPGRVLSSLIKEIGREKDLRVNIYNVEDMRSLNKTLGGVGILNG